MKAAPGHREHCTRARMNVLLLLMHGAKSTAENSQTGVLRILCNTVASLSSSPRLLSSVQVQCVRTSLSRAYFCQIYTGKIRRNQFDRIGGLPNFSNLTPPHTHLTWKLNQYTRCTYHIFQGTLTAMLRLKHKEH